jgi:hypothetical protein
MKDMKNTYTTKQIIIITLIIIVIGVVVLSISPKKENIIAPENNTTINNDAEKLFIEKYITDNIGIIAPDKPVLGGSWYVISLVVNPITHTGEVTYEDGHIQSTANFTYIYEKSSQSITITKWEVIE